MKNLLYLMIVIPFLSFSQCDENEHLISISSTTGEWAYEMAWGIWDYTTWMEIGPENNNALALFQGENNYETISFEATDCSGTTIKIDAAYVQSQVSDLAKDSDLNKFIL